MFCPVCASEYREGFTHCNDCDVDLVEQLEPQAGDPKAGLVKIYEAGNAAVIPMIESVLNSADIEFMTRSEPIQDLFGWGRFGSNLNYAIGPIEFYVREEAADEARALLQALPEPDSVPDAGEEPASRGRSGRPEDGEFASYAKADIDFVEGDDAIAALEESGHQVAELLESMPDERLTYAPGKWTLKEVIGHLIDDERIFAYRALCVARGEPRALPGFDENAYVRATEFESRSIASLAAEHDAVRRASIAFFASLTRDEWMRRGTVNEYEASVRGLAFHMAGHELHHLRVLREKYLR